MLCLAKGSADPKPLERSRTCTAPSQNPAWSEEPEPLVGTEHAVTLLGNDLFGLRDGKVHGGVAVLEHVGSHEAVLLEAVGKLFGNGTSGQPAGALPARCRANEEPLMLGRGLGN